MIRLAEPLWLLLLIPIGAALAFSFRHVHGMVRARKVFSFVLRGLMLSLVVVALAGPEWRRPNDGLATVFVLDRSDSIRDTDRTAAERFLTDASRTMRPEDRVGLVVFGASPSVDTPPVAGERLGRVLTQVDAAGSDLAGAIRLASGIFPDGKARRIVVLSDGNETVGEATEAAQVAASQGIQVDVVPLGTKQQAAEVTVLETQVPADVPAGQPFEVRVVAEATEPTAARLVLDRDGVIVSDQRVRLVEGTNRIVVSQTLDRPGFARYRASLYPDGDFDRRNNFGMGFVQVQGKPRFLVLASDPTRSPLAEVLRRQGLDVVSRGPDGVPTRPEQLQGFDAVIFNDLNASALTVRQMRNLTSAIRETGVGFAMVGGENSFLPGGYYGTPIEDALPVDLDIRQRKNFPSTAILIVADASGSMSMIEDGQPKIRLAAKAAEQTVQLLSPLDRVGVAGSTDGIQFVAPMQKLTDKGTVIAQIQKLSTGGGGIYVRPSLEFAYGTLRKEQTRVRHLILLADGNDCDTTEGALLLAQAAAADKITTSVVAIGDGKDVPFLKNLAAVSGGRFYLATRAGQLPAIFTQDAAIMSRSAIEEGAFLPKVAPGEEILAGIARDSIPPLLAYCLTDARPLARVGMATHKDDPLLATWTYGLGTSLAFTSDAQPRWASRWIPWGGFGTFWAQAARSIARRAAGGGFELSARHDGARGVLELSAQDAAGSPRDGLNPVVQVATPDGNAQRVALSQVGPGLYRGQFAATELGTYIAALAEESGPGAPIATAGFSLPYPAEYRSFRTNMPVLTGVLEAGGGESLTQPRQAFRPRVDPGQSFAELAPLLILLAALLLPLDVAARRVALPLAEILAAIGRFLRRRTGPVAAPTAPVEALRGAKARVRERSKPGTPPPSDPFVPPSTPTSGYGGASMEAPPEVPVTTRPAGDGLAGQLLEKRKKRDDPTDPRS